MDPTGLITGVVGLASLFSTCLDLLDKFQSYQTFANDSEILEAQFQAEKLRFEKWGSHVGLENGSIAHHHHPALDDSKTASAIQELLRFINAFFQPDQGHTRKSKRLGQGKHAETDSRTSHSIPRALDASKEKLVWAVWKKSRREDEVKVFATLVQQLHSLVPLRESSQEALALLTLQDESEYHTNILSELKEIWMNREKERKAEMRRALQEWLLGPSEPNDIYSDAVNKRLDGTCDWILGAPKFINWLAADSKSPPESRLLWINGPAGFGKTILFARLVEFISLSPTSPVAYFFFSSDFESRRDSFSAARSWICQLMVQDEDVADFIYDAWLDESDKIASQSLIARLLIGILKLVPGCTLALDGLDECIPYGGSGLRILELIKQVTQDTTTRVLIASRAEPDIRHGLEDDIGQGYVECKITTDDVRADTALYSQSIIQQRLPNKNQSIRDDISERMTERCDGQFLWIKMQADRLRKGMNKVQLQREISGTPTGLTHVYERYWKSLDSSVDKHRAVSLLRWAAFSIRPLTVSEITEAVLIEDGATEIPSDELPDAMDEYYIDSEITDLCGALLEVRKDANVESVGLMTVHIPHFSVKEFLLPKLANLEGLVKSNNNLLLDYEKYQNTFLAKRCLQYISFSQVWDAPADPPVGSLRDYAAGSWYRHSALGVEDDLDMQKLTNKLFEDTSKEWTCWIRWYRLAEFKFDTQQGDSNEAPNPLYYAARLGLDGAVRHLLSRPGYEVERGEPWESPLAISCHNGSINIAKMLIEAGANPSLRDYFGHTPLFQAALRGDVSLVNLLLEKGADIMGTTDRHWTAVNAASSTGSAETVQLLIEKGADFRAKDRDGYTPIHSAAQEGHCSVIKLLLEKGVELESRSNFGQTALNVAVRKGRLEASQLLIEAGADITTKDAHEYSLLETVVLNDDVKMCEELVGRGADMAAVDDNGMTPLHYAAGLGRLEIVKLLIDKGASISPVSLIGYTPLHQAAHNGHCHVVKLLIEREADVTALDKEGWTPLHSAVAQEHLEAAQVLIQSMPSLSQKQDNYGRTALHEASRKGYGKVVDLLLAHDDSNINVRDWNGSTALLAVVRRGLADMVEQLLGNDKVDITVKDGFGGDAIAWARHLGYSQIEELLLFWAKQKGIALGDGKPLSTRHGPSLLSDLDTFCDACYLYLEEGSPRYHCQDCFDFDLCVLCFEIGVRCPYPSHQLALEEHCE